MQTIAFLKRFLAGAVGVAMLFPSLFFIYRVGLGIYYDYFLFPKLKLRTTTSHQLAGETLPSRQSFGRLSYCCYTQPFA
jgi:hypothetical protein